jgi:SAM-dependent methyltransferase
VTVDPDAQRAESAARWNRAAAGWKRAADHVREMGMPVSVWLIDHAELQPGQRVLELAAGPGDTGFLAAELIEPGGTLICSDGSEEMQAIAKERAQRFEVTNVEFKQLQLEWIDLETASVDVILCRWGIMLTVDPSAAVTEARRVLRPGGRLSVAVWDEARENPWATLPGRVLVELGHAEPPDPEAPGMFTLAAPGQLQDLLESAGFTDVEVDGVDLPRRVADVDAFVAETLDLSRMFADTVNSLSAEDRTEVVRGIGEAMQPYEHPGGGFVLPGRTLVAAASA